MFCWWRIRTRQETGDSVLLVEDRLKRVMILWHGRTISHSFQRTKRICPGNCHRNSDWNYRMIRYLTTIRYQLYGITLKLTPTKDVVFLTVFHQTFRSSTQDVSVDDLRWTEKYRDPMSFVQHFEEGWNLKIPLSLGCLLPSPKPFEKKKGTDSELVKRTGLRKETPFPPPTQQHLWHQFLSVSDTVQMILKCVTDLFILTFQNLITDNLDIHPRPRTYNICGTSCLSSNWFYINGTPDRRIHGTLTDRWCHTTSSGSNVDIMSLHWPRPWSGHCTRHPHQRGEQTTTFSPSSQP